MCTQNQLNDILQKVANEAKKTYGDMLECVILYGSYARGDYDDESDIDIMVRINCPTEELMNHKYDLIELESDLSLETNITISILVYDTNTFNRYRNHLPFFENIEKDGVKIA